MWTLQPVHDDSHIVKNILIVEDDTVLGHLLLEAIQDEMTYQVYLVPSGEMALSAIQTIIPTMLLLDYHLPGMNGLELVDQLRSREGSEQIPILLMSAVLPQINIAKYHLRTLQKPFDLKILLQLIAELL
jgi:DNA-binding response OmpR family regulator